MSTSYDKSKHPNWAEAPDVLDQATKGYLVVESDVTDLPIYAKALYIEQDGILSIIPVGNDDEGILTIPVKSGPFSMWQVRRVLTASNCGAIWAAHD